MTIYIGFNVKAHQETKEMVQKNYEELATKLAQRGFETEEALNSFRSGKAILGAIVDGDVHYFDGTILYQKQLVSYDSPFIGYNFTKWDRAVLSIRTVLNFFIPLVIQKNEDLLTLLYRLEQGLLRTTFLTEDPGQASLDPDYPQVIKNGVLKKYRAYQPVTVLGKVYERWNFDRAWPVYIPQGVKVIGGLKQEGDEKKYSEDAYYHPFTRNCDVKMVVLHPEVEEVGDKAFEDCDQLRVVVLSKNLKRIGKNAFYGCKQLKMLVIHPHLEFIDEQAFHQCCPSMRIFFQGNQEEFRAFLIKVNNSKAFDRFVHVTFWNGKSQFLNPIGIEASKEANDEIVNMIKQNLPKMVIKGKKKK